jgi:hypothetical protein
MQVVQAAGGGEEKPYIEADGNMRARRGRAAAPPFFKFFSFIFLVTFATHPLSHPFVGAPLVSCYTESTLLLYLIFRVLPKNKKDRAIMSRM